MLCRYSYYPDTQVLEVVKRARQERLPTDAVWLDIHYMDGFRAFTWDKSRFPDLSALTRQIHGLDMKVVSMIDPGIKADPVYTVFQEGIERDAFLKYPDGGLYIGKVWPGNCVFPDFSRKDVREWWGGLYRGLVDAGVDGFWNDMNEPAVFDVPSKTMDDEVVFDDSGLKSSHRKMHNVYGLLMTKASFEGLQRIQDPKRPFLLSRSGFSGIQRYAAVWTGDNTSSFEHLRLQGPMFMNMGLSGVSFVGSDIGGFEGSPGPELLVRWYEASALIPLMRNHTNRGTYDQEPWVYGEPYTELIRKAIGLRYRLLPYLYSCFYEASIKGKPILRPLVYAYPDDPTTYNLDDTFLVGDDILVAPVLDQGALGRYVYLPHGAWYDFQSKATLQGPQLLYAQAPLGTLPLFIKEGSVLPTQQEDKQAASIESEALTLEIYPPLQTQKGESSLYVDEGLVRNDPHALFDFRIEKTPRGFSLTILKEGTYDSPKNFLLKLFSETLASAQFDGKPIEVLRTDGVNELKIPAKSGRLDLFL
jgi:alpha-glucosidase